MISNSDSDRVAMDCARVVRDEVTEQYVAGRLREDDQAAFEQHYFQCGRCFEELTAYRALRAELERVSALPQLFPALRGRRLLWGGAGAAAVIAIALLTLRQPAVLDRDVDRAALPAEAVEPTPRMTLAELGAVGPPPYQAITLRGAPDPATRTFRDAMRDYDRGDYVASAKGLAAAARLDPASPQTHFYLGASYLLSGDTDAAVTALQTTIDRGESAFLEDARFYLAKAFIRHGNLDEARAQLLNVASLKGDRERDARSLLAALALVQKGETGRVTSPAGVPGGIDARIITVDGTRAYINIGASNGVRVGDKFSIVHREEAIDPVTGMRRRGEEQQTGTGVVVEVQERFAIIQVTGQAAPADVIRKM
jgi:hypothetical protein